MAEVATFALQPRPGRAIRPPCLAEHVNEWGLREYLVVNGVARLTEGGAPELLQRLARPYLGPEVVFPAMPNPPPGFVTRIRVERVSGIGPWRRDR